MAQKIGIQLSLLVKIGPLWADPSSPHLYYPVHGQWGQAFPAILQASSVGTHNTGTTVVEIVVMRFLLNRRSLTFPVLQ